MKICKECLIEKELTEFYKHPQGVQWTLPRCKECIKKWRKSERELEMSRERDRERYKNNPKRRAYIFEQAKRKRNDPEYKHKRYAQWVINNFFRKNPYKKPSECIVCKSVDNIEMHHTDYERPNIIIPLCSRCHSKEHSWRWLVNKDMEIDIYNFKYKTLWN